MLVRLILVLGFIVLAAGGASAASFDCGKASTPFETIICESPTLSGIDEKLAVAYATAIGGLGDEAKAAMRQGQRDWLDFVQLYCTETGEGPLEQNPQTIGCLESEFGSRMSVLEGSRMLKGWRIYLDQHYAALPDTNTDTNEFSKVAAKVAVAPRLDGGEQIGKEFNAFAADFISGVPQLDDVSSDNSIIATIDDIRQTRITLRVSESYYPHGAAHGDYQTTFVHYLPFEGRRLEASDIFSGAGWEDVLAKLVTDALRTKLGDLMWTDIDKEIREWVVDPERWTFTDESLIVQFRPYETASYADGEPSVAIPWTALQEYTAASQNEIVFY